MSSMYLENQKRKGQIIVRRANGTIDVQQLTLDENGENVSRTQQQFADECNINKIMERHGRGEDISHLRRQGQYRDLTTAPTYQQAMDILNNANTAFDSLPARLRKEFDNDPQKFLEFVHDEKSYERGVALGLYTPTDDSKNVSQKNDDSQQQKNASQKTKSTGVKNDSTASGGE